MDKKRTNRREDDSKRKSRYENRNLNFDDRKSKTENRGRRSEAGSQKSDDRKTNPKSEIRNWKSDDRKSKTENRGRRSEAGSQKSDDRKTNPKSEIRNWKSDDRKSKTENRGRRSEVGGQKSDDRNWKSDDRKSKPENRGRRSEAGSQKSGMYDSKFETRSDNYRDQKPDDRSWKTEDRESKTKKSEIRNPKSEVSRPFPKKRSESSRNDYKDKRSFTKNKATEERRAERRKNENSSEQKFERKPLKKVEVPSKKTKSSETFADKGLIRLNRYLSNAGVASRRKADELIAAGEVTVNGEVITELGYKIKPTDKVKFNGRQLKREQMVYVLLNKPKDYITTLDDPQERKTIMELVKNATKERIYPVGRLDRNTTGLLLLTNDGDLAQKLAHPSNKIKKLYEVTLDKNLKKSDFEKIMKGVELEDGLVTVDDLAYAEGESKKVIGIEIHIGRNRIIRRLFESLGYEVEKLDRIMYAGLTKKDLPRGKFRHLTQQEIVQLKHINRY